MLNLAPKLGLYSNPPTACELNLPPTLAPGQAGGALGPLNTHLGTRGLRPLQPIFTRSLKGTWPGKQGRTQMPGTQKPGLSPAQPYRGSVGASGLAGQPLGARVL